MLTLYSVLIDEATFQLIDPSWKQLIGLIPFYGTKNLMLHSTWKKKWLEKFTLKLFYTTVLLSYIIKDTTIDNPF